MPDYNAGKVHEYYRGVARPFEFDGVGIAVVKIDEEFYAFSNYCTHMGVELTGSQIEGKEIICWWHGSSYSLETGEITGGPAYDPLMLYKVKAEGDDVIVTRPDMASESET